MTRSGIHKLPMEVLDGIADRLETFDLLCFRMACKQTCLHTFQTVRRFKRRRIA